MVSRPLVMALLVLLVMCSPVAAAETGLIANNYWNGFKEFWAGSLKKQNGVVLATLGLGVVCVFILTRSKAKK